MKLNFTKNFVIFLIFININLSLILCVKNNNLRSNTAAQSTVAASTNSKNLDLSNKSLNIHNDKSENLNKNKIKSQVRLIKFFIII